MSQRTENQVAEMKKQTIGVEVEMNSITREKAARLAAEFFGTGRYENTAHRNGYCTWSAWDADGREWKFQKDVSIAGPDSEKCEMVTPILHYSDIETLQELCRQLVQAGFGGCRAYVGEKLSYPEERIVSGTVREIAEKIFAPLAVLVVKREKTADDIGNDTVSAKKNSENSVTGSYWRERAKTHGPGLLDDWFVRGEVPMTKQEVRAAALAKLGAAGAKVLYDVGAGTGSVSVELSLMAGQADVYAIECEEKAVELIGKNRERFGCGNLHVVFGKAPQALDSLPAPDAVFIGGTKGNLPEILSILFEKNPSVRIVVTAILLETALQACESLEAFTLKPAEIMQLQVSRSKKAGKGHMLCANNPIFLISAGGCADE